MIRFSTKDGKSESAVFFQKLNFASVVALSKAPPSLKLWRASTWSKARKIRDARRSFNEGGIPKSKIRNKKKARPTTFWPDGLLPLMLNRVLGKSFGRENGCEKLGRERRGVKLSARLNGLKVLTKSRARATLIVPTKVKWSFGGCAFRFVGWLTEVFIEKKCNCFDYILNRKKTPNQ